MSKRFSRRSFIRIAAAAGCSAGIGSSNPARGATGRAGLRRTSTPGNHFVLVHGAWHGAWCWYRITAELERAGRLVTAIDLPGSGIDPTPASTVTRRSQVERVVALLDDIREPVILVGHSAGGPIISEAAEARPERIEKLVYLSAFLVPAGISPTQFTIADQGSLLASDLIAGPQPGTLDVRASARRQIFYNECRRRDLALAQTLFKPVSLQPLIPPMNVGEAFAGVRRFYISCLRDNAISPATQESMYTALPCEEVFTIPGSDHSPFFSHPQALLRALSEIERA